LSIKVWVLETRPQFLTISLVLTHISVNTLNDYVDYRSGVDLATRRTPFSGGSGTLPASLLTLKQVFWLGMGAFLLAAGIGIYFVVVVGWLLLPLLLVAAFCILLYTPLVLRTPWPEWAAGLGLGFLPILGLYFAQTAQYTWHAIIAAVPSGLLVHNLLLLNEFPDVEADSRAGRKTLPITMGKDRASLVYSAATVLVYLWIVAWAAAGVMPLFSLVALLTLPFAVKAIRGSRQHTDMGKLVGGMASNVMVVLLTQLLLGIGYVLAVVF
jgi:1,4-dihydroxy-2-naphthoate octaprenyltransferase